MSQRQVLELLKDAILDDIIGLEAQAATVIANEGYESASTNFGLDPWMLSGQLKATGQHNVSVTPRGWSANVMLPNETFRDAIVSFQVSFETFAADPAQLEDTISVFATALMRVLDLLRDYSDANDGTVLQVLDTVSFSFGEFTGGSATSSGFTCTVNIQERGAE